jgi:hypothetical protein
MSSEENQWFESDPLDPVGTGLKTGDVNTEVGDMMLMSTRLRVWDPDVVVPPSELRCRGRRLMVQSFSASRASLHRSHSLSSPHACHYVRLTRCRSAAALTSPLTRYLTAWLACIMVNNEELSLAKEEILSCQILWRDASLELLGFAFITGPATVNLLHTMLANVAR